MGHGQGNLLADPCRLETHLQVLDTLLIPLAELLLRIDLLPRPSQRLRFQPSYRFLEKVIA